MSTFFCKIKRLTSAWSYFAKVRYERAFTSIKHKFPYSWKEQVGFMNSSEKNYHFKQLIQLKVGVCPESELESDNRNCQESESDDGTSDSTALITTNKKILLVKLSIRKVSLYPLCNVTSDLCLICAAGHGVSFQWSCSVVRPKAGPLWSFPCIHLLTPSTRLDRSQVVFSITRPNCSSWRWTQTRVFAVTAPLCFGTACILWTSSNERSPTAGMGFSLTCSPVSSTVVASSTWRGQITSRLSAMRFRARDMHWPMRGE